MEKEINVIISILLNICNPISIRFYFNFLMGCHYDDAFSLSLYLPTALIHAATGIQ